ncbi:MAG TPA: PAS domain S-box protein [Chitinophaga sp.]
MENIDLKMMLAWKMVEEIEDYAVLLLDINGHIESWNKGAEKVKGYKADEIIGQSFYLFYTPEDRLAGRPGRLLKTALDTGIVRDEGWRVRKDGSRFWGSIVITAIHDDDGEVIGFTKVTRDLTAQKEVMDKLRASEERYARMIEEVEDYAIILLDTEGRIRNWNAGAEKLKGYSAAEVVGQHFGIFYLPRDRSSQLPEMLLAQARTEGRAHHEGWRLRKDGSQFWGSIVITALHNDDGEVIGFSQVTKDLTVDKKAEEAQERYLEQLETRNREMEQLTYIASHDLQQPLRTITNYLTMFESKYQPLVEEHGRVYIELVMKAAMRMRELIRAMLEYSTLGVNKTVGEVDANVLLEEVKQDMYEYISSTGARVESSGLPVLRGYRVELRQLLQNLVSNAIKFRKPGVQPQIKISAERGKDKWIFCVQDNGIGIEAQYVTKIFMMFQRLHSKDEYPGTGIGLAYAKKIVMLHNGQIWVQSEPGEGSRFYFSISFFL